MTLSRGERPAVADIAALEDRLNRAERRSADLALIAEMARELARSLDIDVIATVIARTAVELTGASECSLWLTAGDKLEVLASASGIPGPVIASGYRADLLRRSFGSRTRLILTGESVPSGAETGSYVALPLLFDDAVLAVLDLVGFPSPQHLAEEVATLEQALPIAILSLRNALTLEQNAVVTTELRRAFEALEAKQALLEAQNEEIQAQSEELQAQNEEIHAQSLKLQEQNEEIQAQSEELRVQNEQLADKERVLAARNAAVERANTELGRLYELSQQQEARARAIIDATADAMMVVDGEQRIIAVNPAFELLTGFSTQDLVGRECCHLLEARVGEGQHVCDVACPFLSQRAASSSVDATLVARDGRQVWVNVVYGTIYGSDGRPSSVVHALRDISARKELELQKDEFLSIAAHDLKNPLTAIRGRAQLLMFRSLKEGRRPDEAQGLEVIDQQVERMLEMINRLLDVTRLQMGRLELKLEPTELVPLVERVVEQAQLGTDKHRLVLTSKGDRLRGNWDRLAVERILGNLIENALKYSPGGGLVSVRLVAAVADESRGHWPGGLLECSPHESARWAVVSIRDEGIGVPREIQDHLFERYFRAPGARQGASGLGLGLYISKGLVEAHGGHVWLESEPQKGSSFYFSLPLG